MICPHYRGERQQKTCSGPIKAVVLDFDELISFTTAHLYLNFGAEFNLSTSETSDLMWSHIHGGIIDFLPPAWHTSLELHAKLLALALSRKVDENSVNWFKEKLGRAMHASLANPILHPDAIEFLVELTKLPIHLILSTSTQADKKARSVEDFLGRQFFDCAIDEEESHHTKNSRDHYLEIAKSHGILPSEMFVVGDSPTDDGIAREVGAITFLINREHRQLVGYDGPQVDDLRKLIPLVKSMLKEKRMPSTKIEEVVVGR